MGDGGRRCWLEKVSNIDKISSLHLFIFLQHRRTKGCLEQLCRFEKPNITLMVTNISFHEKEEKVLQGVKIIYPVALLSKTLNASRMSSSRSVSLSFLAIMVRNSSKSISPFPSMSTSLIMFSSSCGVGF